MAPPERCQPRGLIFDFDGTIADTMPLHYRAWQVLARHHGFAFSEEQLYALGGVPSRDILRQLKQEQGLSLDPLQVAREKEEAYLALLDEVRIIPEVVKIVLEYHGILPMAVASGGTRRVIQRVLEHLRLREYFHAVVTSENVTAQKPAPDIFLEAARQLGVPASQCLAYEDTDIGLTSIRASGMAWVDVRTLRGSAVPLAAQSRL
jgi:beta-phosphoglucomutase family hydrolase